MDKLNNLFRGIYAGESKDELIKIIALNHVEINRLLNKNQKLRKVIEKVLHEVRYGHSDVVEKMLMEALEKSNG